FAVLATGKGKLITPMSSKIKKLVKAELREKKAVYGNELAEIERAFRLKKTERETEEQLKKYEKKPALRLLTAFRISVNNLFTKKFRTFLTALAGSIGILGIALVLALYSGLNSFIDRQEVALSSYPITITRSASDYEAMVSTVISSLDGIDGKYDKDKVYVYKLVRQLLANQSKENVFDKEMVAAIRNMDKRNYYDIYENYGLNFNIVKKIPANTNILNFVRTTATYYMAINTSSFWTQLPENSDLVLEQYELIAGKYPEGEREVVLILDGKNQISDINLFFNGLDLESVNLDYKSGDDVSALTKDFGDFIGQEYKLVLNDAYYVLNDAGSYVKYETKNPVGTIYAINEEIKNRVGDNYTLNFFRGDKKDSDNVAYTYNNVTSGSISVKISGIIKLKDDISIGVLGTNAIGYTKALTEEVIDTSYTWLVNKGILDESAYDTDIALTTAMRRYGYATVPNSISIYCKNYDGKTAVKAELKKISDARKAAGKSEIIFSDLMSVVLNVVQQFINIITWSLLCLTAISLIVSALMIGIITYVSVLERTREIGVLRALGARKLDISRIFNAETVIIGLISGILGVVITYIVSWPLGALIARFTGIGGLVALPWFFAAILVVLSTLLTLVAGLIPAGIAKRKDPVKALRAE
ncbi:MAG: ABC transporter permease, partial [Clostridia bacterium]|nr:ABC transporter permease [Clostridia bacterium]